MTYGSNRESAQMDVDYAAIRHQISLGTEAIVSSYVNSELYEPVTYLPQKMELSMQRATVKMVLTVLVSVLLPHIRSLGTVALTCPTA